MTTTTWNTTTIDGQDFLVIDTALFRVPLDWDPSSSMFIAVSAPTGGVGNFPALVQGDAGAPPGIDTTINWTALEANDATPDSASWTEISPDVYRLNLALHKGADGSSGTISIINASDLVGSPVAAKTIVVNSNADGFVFQSQKCGDRFVPATIANTPSGNANYTLASVVVPAQPWDWRPVVSGQTVVTGTGADVAVDLLARLDTAASGNVVARGIGGAGVNAAGWPTAFQAGPPAGSADAYDRVAANAAATIYFRAERRTGSDTFTTSATTSTFCVRVQPI